MTLGRVWGISIVIHPSWLLIFGLVTWSLAVAYLPQESPGVSRVATWSVATATSLALFGSILLHELGHSRIALRNGLPISSITLFVFGGVARITREAPAPGVELRIALAGPLTSAILALLFGSAAAAAAGVTLLAVPLTYLARLNAMVAVFNLVPGFPLDGGRIFRALVWWWTGNRERAAGLAARVGQIIAAIFVVVGVLKILRGDVLEGVWLALIGWFLQNAARADAAQAGLTQALGGVRVAQAMSRECGSIDRRVTLERLVHDQVLGAGRRSFVVADDGHLAGLVTLHEIKTVPRERWPQVTAADVMVPAERLTTVTPDDLLLGALQKLDDAGIAQMPVVSEGRLLGMLGREEIVRYLRVRTELGV